MLGRVLIEVGYAEADAVEGALTLQSQERRTGKWRPLGQILVEQRVLSRVDLTEALDALEQRRRMKLDLIEAEKAEQEEAGPQQQVNKQHLRFGALVLPRFLARLLRTI